MVHTGVVHTGLDSLLNFQEIYEPHDRWFETNYDGNVTLQVTTANGCPHQSRCQTRPPLGHTDCPCNVWDQTQYLHTLVTNTTRALVQSYSEGDINVGLMLSFPSWDA